MDSLRLPGKTKHAVKWLFATLQGQAGPGTPYPVPLRHLLFKGGRGSAKSHTVARIIAQVIKALGVRCLCARETQKSIDESVKQLLEDCIHDLGYDEDFDKQKLITQCKNGGQAIYAGLRQQDVNKLKSLERIQLAWCEEAHVLSEHSLDVLAPTIRQENSVIIYSYNPELDDDPVHARFATEPQDDVCVVTLNYRDNPWFPEVLERERQRDYDRDKTPGKYKYHWIWEGHTLPAVEGAIFANEVSRFEDEGRIMPLDYDPKGRVHVVMDLGYGVMTAALVQKFASTVQFIGYYELTHSTYHDLTLELQKLPYRWGKVFMPHDAAHRDPKYGKSHTEVMEELGWDVASIPQIGVENYIEAGRSLFGNAYMSNRDEMKALRRCLKRWRYQISETDTGSKKTHPPMKDEFSHGGETWCYTAVVADQLDNSIGETVDPNRGFIESGYAA